MDTSGNLYGTTAAGGAYGDPSIGDPGGTVFKLTPPATSGGNWTESVLCSFGNGTTDGVSPYAGVITDASGNLYGTTISGGAYEWGTVFKLTVQGNESVLWNFGNGTDGQSPVAALIMDTSGNLYGTTISGGAYEWGTVFKLTAQGNESVLWNFGNGTDGYEPQGLIMDTSGNLYGTTAAGGAYGGPYTGGTVFKLIPPSTSGGNWTESILWSFGNGTDGYEPTAGVIRDTSGNFYGTTVYGGVYTGGTVFEISNAGSPTPTSTPTPSPTHSASPTPTPTPTVTSTVLPPTPTPTVTPTVLPPTPTPTVTPTPTPTPVGPAALRVSPKTLAFGNVDFAVAGSASKVKKLTITNPATYKTAAIISSIVVSAAFTSDPACNNVTLAAGQKLVCDITYTPTGLGPAHGALTITDNAGGGSQTVTLTSAGIQGRLIATPGTLNFGKVQVNTTSAAKTVTLRNKTASTFTISSISNVNPVFVASQNCVGTLVTTDCLVSVTYTPTAATKTTDTLTITDVPDGITKTINLIGTGE
jgi:uncharacterized repeat protein (TIGR03803 family)